MHIKTFPRWYLFKAQLKKLVLLVFVPKQTSDRMAIKIKQKWYYRIFNRVPRLWPLMTEED